MWGSGTPGRLGGAHHDDGLGVDGLRDHVAVVSDVLHHFVEAGPLHLLVLEVAERVANEVEEDAALAQLLDEQVLALHEGRIWGGGGRKKNPTTPTLRFNEEVIVYRSRFNLMEEELEGSAAANQAAPTQVALALASEHL